MGSITGSKNRSNQSSSVWGDQSPFLTDLYQRGADLLDTFQPDQSVIQPAQQAWQQQLNPQMNTHLQAMQNQYGQALGQLDQRTGMNMAGAGTFGGARHGVEQHLNQQNIGNQMGNFLGGQYQADMNRAQGALGMSGLMQSMQPYQQQAGALQNYASIIGNPTVLGQGSSSGRRMGLGIGSK
jgi:hypothetical protein